MCGFLVGRFSGIEENVQKVSYRGPDDTEIWEIDSGVTMAFHRLAIMDLTSNGNQPFESEELYLVCNGEIFNSEILKTDFHESYTFKSKSDCEVLLPLISEVGLKKACQVLDGEFALCLYDKKEKKILAARDPIGIRPLFFGELESGEYAFASEAKALLDLCKNIRPFPPGHYFDGKEFHSYKDITETLKPYHDEMKDVLKNIRELLIKGVEKRLKSDAPIGFLLSGGLDSSLVCSIAAKYLGKKISTFAVGINENPIDTKYAQIVADYLKTDHHEVLFKKADIFESLENLIYRLETYDVTTIRASMGMNMVCKYVKEKTDIKVLLTGEVSDELFGYKYTDFAPSAKEFQMESVKRIKELYLYDVLRADRCISSNSLEARVPFGDLDFVQYVININPALKMNTTGIGKFLLRKAFEGDFLPQEILYREKAAFSDAQGHAVVDYLKEWAEELYTDDDLKAAKEIYPHATPYSKEALMYRDIFEKKFKNMSDLIPDFWMPNKSWENCDVMDPSARCLPNYGKSGE